MSRKYPDTRQPPGEPWKSTMGDEHPGTEWTPEEARQTGRRRSFLMNPPTLVHPDDSMCLQRDWCQQPHSWKAKCTCGQEFRHGRKAPVKTWKIEHGVEHAAHGEACW